MNKLWTNSVSRSDFIRYELENRSASPSVSNVYIAVAFFTHVETIEKIISNNCHIKMVVRLGMPTSHVALKKLMDNENIEIRYYNDSSFHPKLYIFGGEVALVGSANLTDPGTMTNQEIVVSIESTDLRFDELNSLFADYWREAKVLTRDDLDVYRQICSQHNSAINKVKGIAHELQNAIGKTAFPNINRVVPRVAEKNVFIDDYRKNYQEWLTAYNKIKEVYCSVGRRKSSTYDVPIRIEIDAFVSYVRNKHANTEKWQEQPLGWNDQRKKMLLAHINEWLVADWSYYEEICNKKYPMIAKVLESPEAINASKYDKLMDALEILHSFSDRGRHFPGGLPTLRQTFREENDIDNVKKNLSYLLFGEDDAVIRMANLIHDSSYKLRQFGKSNVQELVGWINREELPVVNGRTTKIFRFYGFDTRQI